MYIILYPTIRGDHLSTFGFNDNYNTVCGSFDTIYTHTHTFNKIPFIRILTLL